MYAQEPDGPVSLEFRLDHVVIQSRPKDRTFLHSIQVRAYGCNKQRFVTIWERETYFAL